MIALKCKEVREHINEAEFTRHLKKKIFLTEKNV